MRTLLATLITALALSGPALAEEATTPAPAEAPAAEEAPVAASESSEQPDMMDWYQEQRQATRERSLKDEVRYRERWPVHVKERYNIDIKNADNTPAPYTPETTDGTDTPGMAHFTTPKVEKAAPVAAPTEGDTAVPEDTAAQEEGPKVIPKWGSEVAAGEAKQPPRTTGWAHEVSAPQ